MKVAVMAAGGIGGYYGGLLAKAGNDVTFIARGDHLAAIRERGLSVKSIDDEFVVEQANGTDDAGGIGPVDLVLFCVKTYDTVDAASQIRPIVREDTAIVTFQNGVESAESIKMIVGKGRVVSAPTQIETFIAEPGRIEQRSNFRVVAFSEEDLKSSPTIEAMAWVFRGANFQVNIVADARKAVWQKFLRLAPVAGLSTLARESPYELFRSEEARKTLEAAMSEIISVGSHEGVTLDESDLENGREWALNLKEGIKPSMQKDIERGNRLEIDALSGAVVRLGEKHRVPTPVHRTIFVGLKPEDERNRQAKEKAGR
jgi:2-dehydropantoate 2-reductase